VLTPTIVDDSEDSLLVRQTESNPYDNDAELMQLKTDTENFQKRVASLLLKEPGNLCALDKYAQTKFFFSLRHFGHVSHNSITRQNNIY